MCVGCCMDDVLFSLGSGFDCLVQTGLFGCLQELDAGCAYSLFELRRLGCIQK